MALSRTQNSYYEREAQVWLRPTCFTINRFDVSLLFADQCIWLYKTLKVKIYMYQYFKRQLKTPTCFGSFGIHPQGVLNVLHWNYLWCFVCVVGVWQREIWTCGVCVWCDELRPTCVSAAWSCTLCWTILLRWSLIFQFAFKNSGNN